MTLSELKSKLQKSIDFLKSELSQIRTGRASPALLESIFVEAYGSTMSLRELGSISLLDTQTLIVAPWDKGLLKSIASAVRDSHLGLNPIEDSDRIRIPIPPLTEDRRKELVKVVATKLEDSKGSMRSVRQDAMKDIERAFVDKQIGEDEKFKNKEDVEKVIKDFVENADALAEAKKQDLLAV